MKPLVTGKPISPARILRMCAGLQSVPQVALIGMGAADELVPLIRQLRLAWRRVRRQLLAVFAWSEMSWSVEQRCSRVFWRRPRSNSGRPDPTFDDLCCRSIALDGTRAKWRETVEAMVLANHPVFSLVIHTGAGEAPEILADLETLTPLCDDTTVVLIMGINHKDQATATRQLMQRHGWHSVIMGEIALLSRPPVAIHIQETSDADARITA